MTESRTLRDAVVVTEADAGPYGQRITAGGHQLAADEPTAAGGADSGPTPYDLLLAGLGACTAITVRMYAERKGWPLRHITVRLRHRRVHATDCAGCETRIGQLDHIEREMQFDGELTENSAPGFWTSPNAAQFIACCIPRCSSQRPPHIPSGTESTGFVKGLARATGRGRGR